MGPTRGLAGGFFDQLRQSFKQEVEKNKEFKESLSKLKVCACTDMISWFRVRDGRAVMNLRVNCALMWFGRTHTSDTSRRRRAT